MVVAMVLLTALSGCAGPGEEALTAESAVPDRILVRGFVDDLDQDGRLELHIRLAAVTGTDVHPFDGAVEVLLTPQGPGGLPKAWRHDVDAGDFTDAILPYYEIVDQHSMYRPGDQVELAAEARLDDGTWLEGNHRTTF